MANLKARDLEGVVRQHGFDKGVLMIFTQIIERQNDLEAGMTTMGQMMDKLVEMCGTMMTVAGNMKDVLEDMKPKDPMN